jgi:cupin 2 domain-containing protein
MPSSDEPIAGNLFAHLPTTLADEALEVLAEAKEVRIERILSRGQASPEGVWYDQPQTEFVVLLAGEAHLRFENEDEPRALKPGDYLVIPAHCRHQVAWTSLEETSVWLAVHYGP